MLFSAMLLVGLVSMLYLTQASGIATTGYDIQSLEAEKARWQLQNDQLRLRLGEAQALARVERAAREQLKMAPPDRLIYVQIGAVLPVSSPQSARLPDDAEPAFWQPLLSAPEVLWEWLTGQ
ncbi:MAG: cell division protein FtsL [Chloroflexi bacterium]|nr:cell division protein FtsL [Chloroflexota bacterium]